MFEDFKTRTKDLFFDELDEKFRDFEVQMEDRNKIDLTQFTKRLDQLE